MATKYGCILGDWTSCVLKGPYGVSLWKYIKKGWGGFHSMSSLVWVMVSEFVSGLWCGDTILKDALPMLYHIARNKEVFMAENTNWNSGVLQWDILFTRSVNNWEVGILQSFLCLPYSFKVTRAKEDQMFGTPTRGGLFEVKSYYEALITGHSPYFLCKTIWKDKIPSTVAFFTWPAVRGQILTIKNLQKQNRCLVDWC